MNRTDTEMLDFLLGVMGDVGENAEALHAAYSLGYAGREAISLAMGARTFEPGEPLPPATALDLIADEVKRVREMEGFTVDHDDEHDPGVLAAAGSAYAIAASDVLHPQSQGDGYFHENLPAAWPFNPEWWKFDPADPKRALVKAGQFIVAELDRELRKPTEMRRWADVECPPPQELKVGDRVRMVRADTEWSGWVPAMTAMIGKEYVVERVIPGSWIMGPMVQIDGWNISSRCVEVIQ